MMVVLCVWVLTPNVMRPRPFGRFGVRTSVSWKTWSVLWSTFALGNLALIWAIVAPMPTPRALRHPSRRFSVHPAQGSIHESRCR